MPVVMAPAAQALLAEITARPLRSLSVLGAPGLGLRTTDHCEPFQCSVRVWSAPPLMSKPAAQASHGEITVTPVKVLSAVLGATGGGRSG
jgi:hypothetical protein